MMSQIVFFSFFNYFPLFYSIKPFVSQPYGMGHKPPVTAAGVDLLSSPSMPPYEGRSTHKLRLVELSAFMEQTRDLSPENVRKVA